MMINIERFAAMVQVQHRMADEGDWKCGPVSLLEVLSLEHSEVHHCRVLRWLLDPLAHHALGAAFIRRLAECLGLGLPSPESARVDRENARPRARADVVIRGGMGSWTVVIEAKVNAAEGDHQGFRLEGDWPEPAVLVFLTRRGAFTPITAGDADRWRPLSWSWVVATARTLLNEPPSGKAREVRSRAAIAAWVSSAERSLR